MDDERDAADMLAATLTARGHETRTAYGAAGAFAAVRAFHPDVVLLDLGIPEVSGYDIARELRDEHGDGMFVVAVTGYQRDDARLEPAGFDAHLLKPPDVDRLSSWLVARDRDELT